jgi:predicted ester cyclase
MTGKQLLDQAVEAWNRKDKEGFAALGSPDTTVKASGGVELRGLAGMRQFYDLWFEACPDNVIRYSNVVSEGDQVVGEATFTGTHTGILHAVAGDIPPTGKRVSIDYVGASRFSNGKFTSIRLYFDVMDFMGQLGLVGAPAKV